MRHTRPPHGFAEGRTGGILVGAYWRLTPAGRLVRVPVLALVGVVVIVVVGVLVDVSLLGTLSGLMAVNVLAGVFVFVGMSMLVAVIVALFLTFHCLSFRGRPGSTGAECFLVAHCSRTCAIFWRSSISWVSLCGGTLRGRGPTESSGTTCAVLR